MWHHAQDRSRWHQLIEWRWPHSVKAKPPDEEMITKGYDKSPRRLLWANWVGYYYRPPWNILSEHVTAMNHTSLTLCLPSSLRHPNLSIGQFRAWCLCYNVPLLNVAAATTAKNNTSVHSTPYQYDCLKWRQDAQL